MKTLLNKVSSFAVGAVVLLVGCAMVGLGLTVLGVLAMLALAAFGFALLAAPFMTRPEDRAEDGDTVDLRANPSVG